MPITKLNDSLTPSLNAIQKKLVAVPAGYHKTWRSITPVDTGNARNKTKLIGNVTRAAYGYAVPLDRGHSKQAPLGMAKPSYKWLVTELKRIFRK